MKCIHCQEDSNYSDRVLGYCPKCKHRFAFEPKSGDRFTDMAFQKAIERVSAEGKVRWALDHLFHELQRPKRSNITAWILAWISLCMVGLAIQFWEKPIVFVFGAVAFFTAIGAIGARRRRTPLSREIFQKYWNRWLEVHGKQPSLVPPPAKQLAPPRELEAELSAYSFDRAVICDRPAIVDVLLANQFHFENNCAVLGVNGYPDGVFPVVMKMLRQNPRLNIFVLHDATPEGCRMAHTLRTSPDWFAGIGRVIDVGLRPAHAKYFPHMATRLDRSLFVTATEGITEEEAGWLSKQQLELTVVRPEQLIKRLFRAITAVEAGTWGSDSGGGDGGGFDVIYFGTDAGTSDGGGDSFG